MLVFASSNIRSLFGLFSAFFLFGNAQAAVLVVEGKYQNKNILIQNSFNSNGVGYCAKEIKVNGNITADETNSNAFEIDLKSLKLKFGEKVMIEITHDKGCTPKVLNMEDLLPKPTFETLAIKIDANGLLSWSTKNENGVLPFIVEQFKWNKWIPVGEVDGLGTPEQHDYSFKVTMHSGENKFRVRQKGFNSTVKVSKDVLVKSKVQKPDYTLNKAGDTIDFSTETAYEVYDAYGINLMKGYSKKINIAWLKAGSYYLSYDNKTIDFTK